MTYFKIMQTTGNNNDNRHAKYLVGDTIKHWRERENFGLSPSTLDSESVLVESAIFKNEFAPFKLLQ